VKRCHCEEGEKEVVKGSKGRMSLTKQSRFLKRLKASNKQQDCFAKLKSS